MGNTTFGNGLLSRLATSGTSWIASVGEVFAKQYSRLGKPVQTAIGIMLWCVPIVFWTVMIRLVVLHW